MRNSVTIANEVWRKMGFSVIPPDDTIRSMIAEEADGLPTHISGMAFIRLDMRRKRCAALKAIYERERTQESLQQLQDALSSPITDGRVTKRVGDG